MGLYIHFVVCDDQPISDQTHCAPDTREAADPCVYIRAAVGESCRI